MKTFLRLLLHAAIGGAVTAAASIPSGVPYTGRTLALPIGVGALNAVIHLFIPSPLQNGQR